MDKAVFLDRDGVINELVYHQEAGVIDSPFTVAQFRLACGAAEAIRRLKSLGFVAIVVSNQPGIAKGHLNRRTFQAIRSEMVRALAEAGAVLDGEYYCLHHPDAEVEGLRVACECRKPKPGMLLAAARERDLGLEHSWMIGDSLTDVQAGKAAGVRTMLVGKLKCELCRMIDDTGARPDVVVGSLLEAAGYLAGGN